MQEAERKTARPRVLFVDDEPSIRLTLPAILELHGFDVTATGTVPEALAALHSQSFDVLIADLNIGQPGDGFTVVSAMRRTHPDAVTLIITGYPAFDTALEAIRAQVDDYLVKPAEVEQLVRTIQEKLQHRPRHAPIPRRRVATLLREHTAEIIRAWEEKVLAEPALAGVKLSHKERINHLPVALAELALAAEARPGGLSRKALAAAALHGRVRRKQKYTVLLLLEEFRILRQCVGMLLSENLLAVDVSFIVSDLIHLNSSLDAQIRESVRAFLESSGKR